MLKSFGLNLTFVHLPIATRGKYHVEQRCMRDGCGLLNINSGCYTGKKFKIWVVELVVFFHLYTVAFFRFYNSVVKYMGQV